MKPQSRVVIENVQPNIEDGHYYAKGIVNDPFVITADIFADGHDVLNAHLLYKPSSKKAWTEIPFSQLGNDAWKAEFIPTDQTYYEYKIEAWIDHALTWHHGLAMKVQAGVDVSVELLDGIEFLHNLSKQKLKADEKKLVTDAVNAIQKKQFDKAIDLLKGDQIETIIRRFPEKNFKSTYDKGLKVYADREKAAFSTWYEFFPRSAGSKEGRHGTFKDCEKHLQRIADMGFDTLYFPPVHPIGEKNRKGKNNTVTAKKEDVGSPWAIGSKLGGHKDLHPELGTLDDFKSLIKKANKVGIEVAMDFALQAAPDHPYVKAHPSWFKWRSDGTVQYAENPPKKYQDILPIHFETGDHKELWDELIGIVKYWVDAGIRVFRVDNPHTKPFHFWKELIEQIKEYNKDVLFLAEAFSRPRIMEGLAKAGFTQSYSYFTWRHSKADFIQYLTELTKTDRKDYMRANFWPNTPDINPYELQGASDTKHLIRYFMAFTMSSNAGIYGPVYELMKSDALPGKEEYMDSEKFQLHTHDWNAKNRLTAHISVINKIRKENKALQRTNNIEFCSIENDNILAYFKSDGAQNHILCIVNLDEYNAQNGWVQVPLSKIHIGGNEKYLVTDLVSGSTYQWTGEWNFVELRPPALPYHLFRIHKQ